MTNKKNYIKNYSINSFSRHNFILGLVTVRLRFFLLPDIQRVKAFLLSEMRYAYIFNTNDGMVRIPCRLDQRKLLQGKDYGTTSEQGRIKDFRWDGALSCCPPPLMSGNQLGGEEGYFG